MQTCCKVSCGCVVGLMLFEWFMCRVYSTVMWVHVHHSHGSSSESQERTVHICKGIYAWQLFVQSSQLEL